jgi:Rrf2 family transcriptional regulator, iron-sulfur cluster assembly transcription factor
MFSKACEYGIRAVIYIASESKLESKISIIEIADKIEAPRHFTAKILQALSRKDIISSQKGIGGGFYLNNLQLKQPLFNLVTAIDGDKIFTGCGLGLKECSDVNPCPLHHKFKEIRTSLNKMMLNATIEELGASLDSGSLVLKRVQ